MYSVTKRIDFCYGHRLLDYDGICKHPHGHNAVAEIEIRTDALDARNMVADFSDIKRVVKRLDRSRARSQDDPAPRRSAGAERCEALGEPMYLAREQSDRGAHRAADLSTSRASRGCRSARVTVWETPTSWATYTA